MALNTSDYRKFEANRNAWSKCMGFQDRHSIAHQVSQMTWDMAVFRVVNEVRRLASAESGGGVQLNGLLFDLLDRSFFISQSIAVRRLVDTYKLCGPRGVYSLTSLLKDMQANLRLFTRKHFFEVEGLKYEYEGIKQKLTDYHIAQANKGVYTYCTPIELDWQRCEDRHRQIDCLAGVKADARSSDDTPCQKVFSGLKNRLAKVCDDVRIHVDKFIAHSATPESREDVNADNLRITLGHLWRAHRTICEVTNFISVYLLGIGEIAFLPIPHYSQFKYMDHPLASKANFPKLKQVWDDFDREIHSWRNWGIDKLEAEMKGHKE